MARKLLQQVIFWALVFGSASEEFKKSLPCVAEPASTSLLLQARSTASRTSTTENDTITTQLAACDWVKYLVDNTKCVTGGYNADDQAACQKDAQDAGYQFYQFTPRKTGTGVKCAISPNCDSPTTNTGDDWKVFHCEGSTPAAPATPAPPAPTQPATCDWVQYLGNNTKCIDVGLEADDQAACQKQAQDAGYQFYQFTPRKTGTGVKCSISPDCDSPTTNTGDDWKVFKLERSTQLAACDWLKYLVDNTKCVTGGYNADDQAACQKDAQDAGYQFYQFTPRKTGTGVKCAISPNCDSPTTNTGDDWKVFKFEGSTPAGPATPTPTRRRSVVEVEQEETSTVR